MSDSLQTFMASVRINELAPTSTRLGTFVTSAELVHAHVGPHYAALDDVTDNSKVGVVLTRLSALWKRMVYCLNIGADGARTTVVRPDAVDVQAHWHMPFVFVAKGVTKSRKVGEVTLWGSGSRVAFNLDAASSLFHDVGGALEYPRCAHSFLFKVPVDTSRLPDVVNDAPTMEAFKHLIGSDPDKKLDDAFVADYGVPILKNMACGTGLVFADDAPQKTGDSWVATFSSSEVVTLKKGRVTLKIEPSSASGRGGASESKGGEDMKTVRAICDSARGVTTADSIKHCDGSVTCFAMLVIINAYLRGELTSENAINMARNFHTTVGARKVARMNLLMHARSLMALGALSAPLKETHRRFPTYPRPESS